MARAETYLIDVISLYDPASKQWFTNHNDSPWTKNKAGRKKWDGIDLMLQHINSFTTNGLDIFELRNKLLDIITEQKLVIK